MHKLSAVHKASPRVNKNKNKNIKLVLNNPPPAMTYPTAECPISYMIDYLEELSKKLDTTELKTITTEEKQIFSNLAKRKYAIAS